MPFQSLAATDHPESSAICPAKPECLLLRVGGLILQQPVYQRCYEKKTLKDIWTWLFRNAFGCKAVNIIGPSNSQVTHFTRSTGVPDRVTAAAWLCFSRWIIGA
jgi:hypothetical protein